MDCGKRLLCYTGMYPRHQIFGLCVELENQFARQVDHGMALAGKGRERHTRAFFINTKRLKFRQLGWSYGKVPSPTKGAARLPPAACRLRYFNLPFTPNRLEMWAFQHITKKAGVR